MSSASISPLDCNIWSEMSRIACKVAAELRLGFVFSSGLSASFACRSCWTRAGRSSGGALAIAATAFSVGLMLPERISCLMPGSTSSAASTPFENSRARSTYPSLVCVSRAIFRRVLTVFCLWPNWSQALLFNEVYWLPRNRFANFSASYCCPTRYLNCCGVRFRRPSWFLQIQAMAAYRSGNIFS